MTVAAPVRSGAVGGEPTRARYPDESGYAERDGVRLAWDRYGDGEPTILFVNPGPIVHSRMWKAQIAYLARHGRVVTFDGRGGGRSDRPKGRAAFPAEELAKDAMAVLDATGTERAVAVTISAGSRWTLWALTNEPERFAGAVFIGPYLPLSRWQPVETMRRTYWEPSGTKRALRMIRDTVQALPRNASSPAYRRFARHVRFREGVHLYNGHAWLRDQRAYVDWFVRTLNFAEPHSTRQIEDGIAWGMDADPQTLVDWWHAIDIDESAALRDRDDILRHCTRVRCPVLVIQGAEDLVCPPAWGAALAEATGGRYLSIPNCGHQPQGRKPVPVNLALREFVESVR